MLHGDVFFLDNFAIRQVQSGSCVPVTMTNSMWLAGHHRMALIHRRFCMSALTLPNSLQWDDPNYSGTRIAFDKATFVTKVHEMFKEQGSKLVRCPC